ncbi:MAG TPA: PilT/PilU family type 4a pilus ATPase [Vicinamibacterales bacterium]|nr:PilT/PilU family type 4a pilus ATPase [Vicinamibacterales bacterium]
MEPPEDLNALVDELAAQAERTATTSDRLLDLLRRLAVSGASDLFLVAGVPATVRVAGAVQPLDGDILDSDAIEGLIRPTLPSHSRQQWQQQRAANWSVRVPGIGRFRINLHHERGRTAAAVRLLPTRIPTVAELNLPPEIDALTRVGPGLVLIGGATGSGKTTTLAALIDVINRRDRKHIITIEDPIEYEHQHHASVVEQIEVGTDCVDAASALREAVRQAPDVIVLGEMRDPDTMRTAVAAAETGHAVFSTLHTTDVASTVGRISDSFPAERQPTIRQELAMALTAVLTQRLVPSVRGGRVPACELLMVGYGARQHIRKNALHHLHQEITISRKYGSFTLEEQLQRLVRSGSVSRDEALGRAQHPEELEGLLA